MTVYLCSEWTGIIGALIGGACVMGGMLVFWYVP